jgi:hypothetical protein
MVVWGAGECWFPFFEGGFEALRGFLAAYINVLDMNDYP